MASIEKLGKNAAKTIAQKGQELTKVIPSVREVCDKNGTDKTLQLLENTGNIQKGIIGTNTDSLSELQKKLLKRLTALDTSTALHRFEGENTRFGEEGIESIMDAATTKSKVAKVNAILDELESGKQIWTGDIVDAISSSKLSDSGTISGRINFNPVKTILSKKSTNPRVIELEAKMKSLGYNANFANKTEAAEVITRAYENMAKRGYKMPDEVKLMIPAKKGILGYRPYVEKGNEFKTPILFNANLTKKEGDAPFALKEMGIRFNSTDSPEGVVYHEIGHFLHEFSAPDVGDLTKIWKEFANNGYDADLAKEVGYYAMMGDRFNMGREYVAEVFAGLMDGKKYSKRAMDLYYKLGGPQVK